MRKISTLFVACICFCSCSIQQMAYNGIAPLPEQKYKDEKKAKPKDAGNPILAFTGESDIKLVADSFPVLLKSVEALYFNNPKHRGIALMAGQLYVMYANAFVERPAKHMSDNFYNEKYAKLMRAKKFYLRGSNYALQAIDMEYAHFLTDVFSGDETRLTQAVEKLQAHNVEAVFYGASGLLGAFALEPMNADLFDRVYAACRMLEKATELIPSYSDGALWEILTSFYVAAPEFLGGGVEKAKAAYEKALEYSQGKSPSIYLTYANAFCIPAQDGAGFDAAIEKALAIDPDANPETRLMTILAQDDARWMKAHRSEFIY